MPSNESSAQNREQLEQEAVAWYARLASGEMSAEERAQFAAWKNLSPGHEKADRKIRKLWQLLPAALTAGEALGGPAAMGARKGSEEGAKIISLETARHQAGKNASDNPGPAKPYAAGIVRRGIGWAAVASLLLAIGLSYFPDYLHHPLADYRTLIGEQNTVHLADGSTVYLNTDTAVDVSLTEHERRIALLQGEAEFEVAHDSTRPFRVIAGRTSTEAVGTRFTVRYADSAGEVTLLEGRVRTIHATDRGNMIIKPGERLAFDEDRLGEVSSADPSIADAWRRGRLVMNFAPLQDVVAEINRYRRGRVILLEPVLAQSKIHVSIELEHIDDWLDALDGALPVRVRHVGNIVLLQGH